MVRQKLGVGVLAPWAVAAELQDESLSVRSLGAKTLQRRWVLAHTNGRRLSLAEEQFFRLMERETAVLWRERGAIPAVGEKSMMPALAT